MDTAETQENQPARWANQQENEKRARALVLGIVAVLFVGLTIAAGYFLWDLRQVSRRASCMNDIFYLREGLRRYAVAHDGLLPPLDPARGNLMIDPEGFYPDFLKNSCWLQCEWSHVRRTAGSAGKNNDLGLAGFTDDSFCYLPWAIRSEAEGLAFIVAYKTLDLSKRYEDLVVNVNGTKRILQRIRLSGAVLEKTIDTVSSSVPIAVEWPDKFHRDGNVLFSDGSIVALERDEAFPMTTAFINGLREIASMDRPLSKQ